MQEWNEHKNEYTESAQEYAERGSEYFELPSEYPEIGAVTAKDTVGKAKKKSRKMVYMIAAALSVTTIGQTLTPQNGSAPQALEPQQNQTGVEEYEWPTVPGWDGVAEKTEDAEEAPPEGMLYLDAYESFGYSDDGVVPVKIDGLWGLANLQGEIIVEPKYEQFWVSPNEDGYTVFRDESGYYIVGKDGHEYAYDANVTGIQIGEGNIVKYLRYDEESWQYNLVYEKLNGNVLYEMPWLDEELGMANVFRNGKVYIAHYTKEDEQSWLVLEELSLDGTIRQLINEKTLYEEWSLSQLEIAEKLGGGGVAFTICGPYDGYSDGYFVGTIPGDAGGMHLFNPLTGEGSGRMMAVILPEHGVGLTYDMSFKYYRSHGMDMMHYKSLGCATIYINGEEQKDILFDFRDCQDDEALKECIALHDEIIFDDYEYLAARDGSIYFYIDVYGTVVSDRYVGATAFNDRGYALVLDASQTAYIIDDEFNVKATFHGVEEVTLNDQLFVVDYVEGNADQKKVGAYGFYYGE